MNDAFPGLGTLINVATIVVGSLLGMAVGHRLPDRTRWVVTDCLGLTTLLMAGLSAFMVTDASLASAVGVGAPILIVLGSLLIGGITGSLLRVEGRLEGLAGVIQARLARRPKLVGAQESGQGHEARERFIEGWLSASLLFCVGPLTILGSLSDGLGRGIDQLALKSTLDGFAALAFAASLGWGVAASALSVGVVQGLLTLLGFALGGLLPASLVAAVVYTTATLLLRIEEARRVERFNRRQVAFRSRLQLRAESPHRARGALHHQHHHHRYLPQVRLHHLH